MDRSIYLPSQVLDSISPVNPVVAKTLGYHAIGRYLPVPGAQNGVTKSELQTYTTADFGCFVVAELDPNAPSDLGETGGREYGEWAVAAADSLNIPAGVPLRTSNDAVVTSMGNVEAFFGAFEEVVRPTKWRPSLYGQSEIWEIIRNYGDGFVDFWHAPDGTNPPWPSGTSLAQNASAGVVINGARYDTNEVLTPYYGAFNYNGLYPGGSDTELQLPTYTLGQEGVGVCSAQGALNSHVASGRIKGPAVTQDGIFGQATLALLHQWQKATGQEQYDDIGDKAYLSLFPAIPHG